MTENGIRLCTIDYVNRAADATRRLRRGERQSWCAECGWVWPDQCQHAGRLSEKEYRVMVRAAKAQARKHPTEKQRYEAEQKHGVGVRMKLR